MSHGYQQKQSEKRHSRYLDIFIGCKCAPDLLEHRLFPNTKEITESFAMYDASGKLPEGYEWNRKNVTCVVVGDGTKPRTGAMFAYRTAWNVVSIDPNMSNTYYGDINRFKTYKNRIEDLKLEFNENTVIVLPHSHAKIQDCLDSIKAPKRSIITMDCCVKNNLDTKPDVVYNDLDVWSPMNEIKIWRDVNGLSSI